jgi:hypothetical protein
LPGSASSPKLLLKRIFTYHLILIFIFNWFWFSLYYFDTVNYFIRASCRSHYDYFGFGIISRILNSRQDTISPANYRSSYCHRHARSQWVLLPQLTRYAEYVSTMILLRRR